MGIAFQAGSVKRLVRRRKLETLHAANFPFVKPQVEAKLILLCAVLCCRVVDFSFVGTIICRP
jgi:hypothetical protein